MRKSQLRLPRCKSGRTTAARYALQLVCDLGSAQSNDELRQGGQEQHKANAEQDDILEEKFAGQIPGHGVSRPAPFNDARRREEE